MNAISAIRTLLRAVLLAACIPALSLPALAAPTSGTKANAVAHPPAVHMAKGGSAHSTQTMPATLRPVFYQALAKDAGATYNISKDGCAVHPKQTLKGCFDTDGAHFTGATPLSLHLVAWGRGNDLAAVTSVEPQISGNQASYRHSAISEWWRVLSIGFEQGFTIARRPAGHGELTLALAMSQPETAAPQFVVPAQAGTQSKNGIPTKGRDTNSHWIPASAGMTKKKNDNVLAWGKLRYGQLVVTDAKGKIVPAMLTTKGSRILIAVNDAHATYPLTVDPLVWLEQKVTASDGSAGDKFGWSVAVSGTKAFVGAPNATVDGEVGQGAAYVFTYSNETWTQTAELTADDGGPGDSFGYSVALSGTTAFIGAPGNNSYQGATYVFDESGGTWSQTAELTASDGAAGDVFGQSVALDGTTALIGAPHAVAAFGLACNGASGAGAAYVFSDSNGTWTQTQKFTASDGAPPACFGYSVALSGTTALIGAPGNNSYQGATYVFDESGGTWSQTAELTASDGAGDYFGGSVALDGTTALVGSMLTNVNGNGEQGAAFVFDESGGTWSQTAELTASDGAEDDEFGTSVALSGTTALVGAPAYLNDQDSYRGAAYVFSELNGNWTQMQKFTPSDDVAYGLFGSSVAIPLTTALIGAPGLTINGNNPQGAGYFENQSALDLLTTAPAKVYRYSNYLAQAIATNDATATSPAVAVTVTVPAAASFVSATSTQGTCGENAGVVTCNFGQIGQGGFASANVTLEAIGNGGSTIESSSSIAKASPNLSNTALTLIHPCAANYLEYDGTLAPNARYRTPAYQSAAGKQTVMFSAPLDFVLKVGYQKDAQSQSKIKTFSRHAIYEYGPAGTYRWQIDAGPDGGAYTLCILHP